MARDPIGFARRLGVTVGKDCRLLGINRGTFGSEPYLVRIGDHVTITSGVQFVTHDGGVWVFREEFPEIEIIGPIVIHDNVFIGMGAILLPNIEIGPNAVVAAGAVVSHTVPPNTVVGGVPAKRIKSLSEYRASVLPRALHVRDLTLAERQAIYSGLGSNPRP